MAKRSKRRQVQQNKDEAGCMSGLISIFDFRNGRTTRKLLSDKRVVTKNTVVSDTLAPEVNMLSSSEERHVSIEDVTDSEKPTLDVVKTSVKELMEEEMVSEHDFKMQPEGEEVEKTSNKSFNDQEISISSQDLTQKTSQYSDLEALMKEILLIYQQRNHRDLDEGQNCTLSIVEEKLSAAVEVFLNEKSSDERCKDFIDTFQMLNFNKELFLKLLQDQTSLNPNEDQKSKSKSNSLENEPNSSKPDVPVTRKHRNFFRRRIKSQESMPLSRIVILKPNSLSNRFKMENDVHSEKLPSHFSLKELKKRLKNAMGKEPLKPGGNEKNQKKVVEGSSGWSSPNRDPFYTEKFTKKIERVSKLYESETEQNENVINGDISQHISNIYTEAKKHLSEMLNNDEENIGLTLENLPKTLGKILLFPEHNALSPGASPRKENEHDFVTAQMSLCPRENCHSVNNSQPCAGNVDLEEKPKVCDEVNPDILVGGIPSYMINDTSPEDALEIEKPENQEEIDVFCEPCSSPESMDDKQYGEIAEVSEKNEFSSPTGSSHSNKIEEPESSSSDKTGRPSPVSVLVPLFSDNEISHASTTSRIVEVAIQPLCIQFEDEDICTRNCIENEESAFEYVEAVLLASDLNWDEFEKKWLSSIQILDSTLFHEVEIFSRLPSHDQRLLFDSTNEIIKEVCDCYLDFFLQLSFIKQNIQPVPKCVNLINKVWERIKLRLKDNYFLSLDHLVKKDLRISKTWMDLCSDSRNIVFEIDESIFEDIIDDTLMSLFDDCVDNEVNLTPVMWMTLVTM